jgi:type III restriction enzyme
LLKNPPVATRENFDASNYDEAGLERLKLEDGLRLHENTKVELEVYARENSLPVVKPFMLVIAKDTTHADELLKKIEDSAFFEGRYKGKAIVVHSNLKGEEKDETIEQLINVEKPENPVEIVIHVNMLKEGWDVTNLYTIVPLRTANSKTLVEQSIGRGLRLPYGKRTGVAAVDRLTIVSHDKFQEIVDYANSPDSIIRGGLKVIHITDEKAKPVTAPPEFVYRIEQETKGAGAAADQPPLFGTSREREAAKATLEVIRREYERLPKSADLSKPEVQKEIVKKVEEILTPAHPEFSGAGFTVDIKEVVAKTVTLYQELSIDIPRITVQPVGGVHRGYKDFNLDLSKVRLQPVDHEILIQELHKRETYRLTSGSGVMTEKRPEDYIVRGLMDFYDINYDEHSALLYKLAAQVVEHLKSYLTTADDILNVLQYHQQPLANLVHAQMQEHFEETAVAYEAHVSKGFTTLRTTNYMSSDGSARDVRAPVSDKQDIAKMVFGGFKRCLYRVQKFDSDPERRFAVILETDKEVLKWLRPSKGDFYIYHSAENSYEPDFAVETKTGMLLCEVKRSSEMTDPIVLAKAKAATEWCLHATEHALKHCSKPWAYLLIPDTAVAENKTLKALADAHVFHGK